jgi:hypothetical protein
MPRQRLTKDQQIAKLVSIKSEIQQHRKSECSCRGEYLCDGEVAALVAEMRSINKWMERYG